jgi:long-chain acyl-CoA synthetase
VHVNIAQHVEAGRRACARAPALTFEGACWSYADLDRLASQTAYALQRLGVERGDRVALYLPNCPEWVWAYLGALKVGAIAVSLAAALRAAEVAALVADATPKVLITTRELRDQILHGTPTAPRHCLLVDAPADAPAALGGLLAGAPEALTAVDLAPDAPAAIVYTSGTTGRPKGATLSHGNVVLNARAKVRYLGIRPDDRLLLFLPLHHCFGQNAVLNAALQAGASVVLQPRFDPDAVLAAARAGAFTMFFGIPASYALLLERAAPADLRAVRYYFSAAAPLPPEIERRWTETFGLPIHQGYGLTETSPFASYNHERRHQPGSIGTPIEGVEMRVVDAATGAPVAPGEPGEIVIRGHNVMLGYWRQPEETARVLRDGWFHTGDIGRQDADGYFYLLDRVKDMINVGGLKVYPAEVDAVLCACPGVAEAAAYGAPDPVLGEQVRAAVVPRPGVALTAAAVVQFCRARLASYKVPAAIEFREALPKTPTGKVLRRVLRAEATPPPAAPAREAPTVPRVRAWVTAWLAARLGAEAVRRQPRATFADLGLTSVEAVQLAQELSAHFGVALAPTALWSHPTADNLARHVAAEAAGAAVAAPAAEEHDRV